MKPTVCFGRTCVNILQKHNAELTLLVQSVKKLTDIMEFIVHFRGHKSTPWDSVLIQSNSVHLKMSLG